jgi:hypothetical protein
VKLCHQIPESAMVAVFLRGEIQSERFAHELLSVMNKLNVPERVVVEPDLQVQHENQLRDELLGDYRGYKQDRKLFEGFPIDLAWFRAELRREEIGGLRYIDYSYWNELTNNTRLVRDAVDNIQAGRVVFNVSNDPFLSLADTIKQNGYDLEPVILWGKDKHSPLSILEGHARTTALGLAGEEAPAIIPAIVGLMNEQETSRFGQLA